VGCPASNKPIDFGTDPDDDPNPGFLTELKFDCQGLHIYSLDGGTDKPYNAVRQLRPN